MAGLDELMRKKIGPVPMPVAIAGGGAGLFLLYKHFKGGGSSASASASGTDPNAIDPATGLTYAQEAAQAQGQPAAGAAGAVGGVDLSGLGAEIASALQSAGIGGTGAGNFGGFTDPNELAAGIAADLQSLLQPSSAPSGGGGGGGGGAISGPQVISTPYGNVTWDPNAPSAYVFSSGKPVGYIPGGTSLFNTSTPAAAGYVASGIKPSDPYTILPTPEMIPTPVTPTTLINTRTGAQTRVTGFTPIIRPGIVGLQ